MKKIFLTVAIAAAFALGMSACCGNKCETPAETDSTECAEKMECNHECMHHECACADTTCKEKNCEGCDKCGTDECCKKAAGEDGACCAKKEGCCKKEGACCEKKEGCKHHHDGCCEKKAEEKK